MASFYKVNPKELPTKALEVVPDAPRMPVTFPPTWDWGLLHPAAAGGVNLSALSNLPGKMEKNNKSFEDFSPNRLQRPDALFDTPSNNNSVNVNSHINDTTINNHNAINHSHNHNHNHNHSDSENDSDVPLKADIPSGEARRNMTPASQVSEPDTREAEQNENVDIWMNDEDNESQNDEDTEPDERKGESDSNEREAQNHRASEQVQKQSSIEQLQKQKPNEEEGAKREQSQQEDSNRNWQNLTKEELDEKTEREIAEERQRMMDEGLLKPTADDENDELGESDEGGEQDEVYSIIKNGDMEKLASMVLNGEGDKLMGKKSKNQEIQSFLDNVPIYMVSLVVLFFFFSPNSIAFHPSFFTHNFYFLFLFPFSISFLFLVSCFFLSS